MPLENPEDAAEFEAPLCPIEEIVKVMEPPSLEGNDPDTPSDMVVVICTPLGEPAELRVLMTCEELEEDGLFVAAPPRDEPLPGKVPDAAPGMVDELRPVVYGYGGDGANVAVIVDVAIGSVAEPIA